jgi:hypothetical protein
VSISQYAISHHQATIIEIERRCAAKSKSDIGENKDNGPNVAPQTASATMSLQKDNGLNVVTKKILMSVGFEPTPMKTTALTLRLRPDY